MEKTFSQNEALDMLGKMNVKFAQQNLVYYAQQGDLNKVELLLCAGLNPNEAWINEKKESRYPLHNTCEYGQVELVKMIELLLKNGANVNLQNEKGETALVVATQSAKMNIAKILIESGADVNIKTKDKINALYVAQKKKNAELIELLKKNGAEELTEQEKKSFEKTQKAVKILTGIILIGILWFCIHIFQVGSSHATSPGSSSSSSSAEHTCGYCNKTFTGNGWNTIDGEQFEQTSWTGYGYCSQKCAYDAQPAKWKH